MKKVTYQLVRLLINWLEGYLSIGSAVEHTKVTKVTRSICQVQG